MLLDAENGPKDGRSNGTIANEDQIGRWQPGIDFMILKLLKTLLWFKIMLDLQNLNHNMFF
jgi:hypothetical protein